VTGKRITNQDIRNTVTDDAASCENPYPGMKVEILRHRLAMVLWRQEDELERLLERAQQRIDQAVNMRIIRVSEHGRVWKL